MANESRQVVTEKPKRCISLRVRMRWAISRLARFVMLWDHKLDRIDKEYCLRRIRDKEPDLFWEIARERTWR